jgi:hypothetical protein
VRLVGVYVQFRALWACHAVSGRDTGRCCGWRSALTPQPGLADLEQLVGGVREAGLPGRSTARRAAGPGPVRVQDRPRSVDNTLKHAGPACARVTVRADRKIGDLIWAPGLAGLDYWPAQWLGEG